MLKSRETYEIMTPESIGLARSPDDAGVDLRLNRRGGSRCGAEGVTDVSEVVFRGSVNDVDLWGDSLEMQSF